jgi:hypothetical protein
MRDSHASRDSYFVSVLGFSRAANVDPLDWDIALDSRTRTALFLFFWTTAGCRCRQLTQDKGQHYLLHY